MHGRENGHKPQHGSKINGHGNKTPKNPKHGSNPSSRNLRALGVVLLALAVILTLLFLFGGSPR